MEAIKLFGTSHDGKLTVSVPKEYDEKELELMIISSKEKKKDTHEIKTKNNKRTEKFMSLVGSAKHPDFPMTKYDVYDQ
ncbi:MAG TPA: hypothetical protein VIJ92_16510 [Ginsengibacter sp.]